MVKGNSKLQFDIKGDTDDSEIGKDNMMQMMMSQNAQ